ncbi:hypothetical protein [Kibdelosporangium philippinense]
MPNLKLGEFHTVHSDRTAVSTNTVVYFAERSLIQLEKPSPSIMGIKS